MHPPHNQPIPPTFLQRTQPGFKRNLVRDVRAFADDVKAFRSDFLRSGPMVQVGYRVCCSFGSRTGVASRMCIIAPHTTM